MENEMLEIQKQILIQLRSINDKLESILLEKAIPSPTESGNNTFTIERY